MNSRPQPDWDRDYAYGVQGELNMDNMLELLHSGQLAREDKRKRRLDAKLYIEVEQNPLDCGRWRPSGLATTKADVWTYTIHESGVVILFPVDMLRRAVEAAQRFKVPLTKGAFDGSNPTRGYLLDMNVIMRWGTP